MPRIISFGDREIEVPDDATDDEISEILSSYDSPQQRPAVAEPPTRIAPDITAAEFGLEPAREVDPYAQAAQRLGIRIGEAPSGARARASFGLNEAEAYRRIFGKENVRVIGPEGAATPDVPASLEGQILFRQNKDEPWTTVRRPDVPLGSTSIPSVAGEVLPFAGGFAGGLAGAAGGIPGAMGGTLGGVLAAETARAIAGIKAGVIDPNTPVEDIFEHVVKRASIDALGAGAVGYAARIFARIMRAGMPDLGLSSDELAARLTRGREQIMQETGRIAPGQERALADVATTGSLLGPLTPEGREAVALQQFLGSRSGPVGRQVYGREREIEGALRQVQEAPTVVGGREAATPGAPGYVPPQELGRQVAAIPGSAREAVEAGVARTAKPGAVPFIDPADFKTGEQMRSALAAEEVRRRGLAGDAIEAAKQAGISIVSDMKTAQDVAKKELATIDLNAIPSIRVEDKKVISDFLNTMTPEALPGGKKSAVPVALDYEQIESTLSALRTTINAARGAAGGQVNKNIAMLGRLEEAIKSDRNKALSDLASLQKSRPDLFPSGSGNVAEDLLAAERQYKEVIDLFRRTNVQRYIGETSGGRDLISDSTFATRLLNDPDGANAMASVFEQGGMKAERELVRSILRFDLMRVANVNTGAAGQEVATDALNRYLVQKRGVLQNFFSEQELSRMKNIAGQAQGLRRVFGVENLDDFSKWFDNFAKAGNPEQASQMMSRLQRYDRMNPGMNMTDTVRAYAKNRLMQDLSEATPEGQFDLVPSKVMKFFQDPGKAEWYQKVIDPGIGERLRTFAKLANQMRPARPAVTTGQQQMDPEEIGLAQRAKTLFLGVLNAPARVANQMIIALSPSLQQRAVRAIMDPDYYQHIMTFYSRRNANKVAALGAALTEGRQISEPGQEFPVIPRPVQGAAESAAQTVRRAMP